MGQLVIKEGKLPSVGFLVSLLSPAGGTGTVPDEVSRAEPSPGTTGDYTQNSPRLLITPQLYGPIYIL